METFLGFAVALLAGLILVPLVRAIALRIGFVDRPDGRRKVQTKSVALGGGIGVFLAFLIGLAVVLIADITMFGGVLWAKIVASPWPVISIPAAGLVVVVAGAIDDAIAMRGTHKLIIQAAASAVVVNCVARFDRLGVFGLEIPLGPLGFCAGLIWMLSAINSINLIDGVDGLAGSVGVIFSISLGIIALIHNELVAAMLAFSLAGGLAAFLVFNRAPATIYLGDAGSMLIGLVLGGICLECSLKEAAGLAFIGPLAIWAVPIFDSLAAIARRKLTGRSIYATDRGHIHHVLLTRGFSANQTVLVIGGLCLFSCAAAIAASYFHRQLLSIIAATIVVSGLIACRVFGHVEFILLNKRLRSFTRHLSNRLGVRFGSALAVNQSCQIQGQLGWESAWDSLVEFGEQNHLHDLRLSLYVPTLHEGFYAEWKSATKPTAEQTWTTSVPLVYRQTNIGKLTISGARPQNSTFQDLHAVWEYLEAFESQLAWLINHTSNERSPKLAVVRDEGATAASPTLAGTDGSAISLESAGIPKSAASH